MVSFGPFFGIQDSFYNFMKNSTSRSVILFKTSNSFQPKIQGTFVASALKEEFYFHSYHARLFK